MAEKQDEKNRELVEEPKPGSEQETAGADPKNTETETQTPGPIPYDRFKEVNERARTYEKRLAELEAMNAEREKVAEEARKAELKKQEKFQELAEEQEKKVAQLEPELEETKKELESAHALLKRYADAQIQHVPELFREVVASMPLTDRLEWLIANADKLGKDKPGGIPATPQGRGNGDELTAEQRRRNSARTF